jgi:hypothetical protein
VATLEELTAASQRIFLGGRELEIRPLSARAVANLNEQFRADLLAIERRSIPADALPEERDRIMASARRYVMTQTWLEWLVNSNRNPGEMVIEALYQSLRMTHPDVTLDWLRTALVAADPSIRNSLDLLWMVLGVRSDDLKKNRTAEPTMAPGAIPSPTSVASSDASSNAGVPGSASPTSPT